MRRPVNKFANSESYNASQWKRKHNKICQELHYYFLCMGTLKILQMNKKRKDRDRCKCPSFGSWCHNKNFFLPL